MSNEAPIRVVHVESAAEPQSWWAVWMTGVTAALVGAIALTFTLVTTVQRADRAEKRSTVDNEREECASLFAAEITEAQQTADNALNELVVLITRQIMSTTPPIQEQFAAAVDLLEATAAEADVAVEARAAWVADGSQIPCPIEPEG